MPFILVHPAAALPFYRGLGRYGVLSALIIGSLTPDMHYFLPLAIDRNATHSAAGLIWFCWPVGIALYLLYHLILKLPLAVLLPPVITSRVVPYLKPGCLPDVSWSAVFLSLLIGATTHIVWDAFTHQHAPVVMAVPGLRSVWFTLGNYPLAGYVVLQQASNVLGFALLSTWFWRWVRAQPAQTIAPPDPGLSSGERHIILGTVLFLPMMVAAVVMRGALTAPVELTLLSGTFKQATLLGMSSASLVALTYSLLWHIRARRRRNLLLQ